LKLVETERGSVPQTRHFKELLEQYQHIVYNQAYRMLGNREDAEEATQDIFLNIFRSLESFRGASKLSTWIYQITANECITRLRRKQLTMLSFDEPYEKDGKTLTEIIPERCPDAESRMISSETAEMIRSQVRRLPPKWAMAISLYHFDDLSYDDIAEIMEIPRATVATYIMRGRKQLAQLVMNAMET
jgi:RNA polymerase sigma-70 factor (ECF subfamily)